MPDRITAFDFDNAVMTFGIWADNRLRELGPGNQPKWTLEDILHEGDPLYHKRKNQDMLQTLLASRVKKTKRGHQEVVIQG